MTEEKNISEVPENFRRVTSLEEAENYILKDHFGIVGIVQIYVRGEPPEVGFKKRYILPGEGFFAGLKYPKEYVKYYIIEDHIFRILYVDGYAEYREDIMYREAKKFLQSLQ